MKTIVKFWGESRWWWAVLLVGILLVISGFAYWFWPAIGFAVASQLFGWLIIAIGIIQLCVSSGENRPRGWGWWLAGGVIDLFIGFVLIRSVLISEIVLPFFLALIFAYWGIVSLIAAASERRRSWWVSLINGVLMLLISYFFVEGGYLQDMLMISFIMSIAFIYWGFTLAIMAYDMKPVSNNDVDGDSKLKQ